MSSVPKEPASWAGEFDPSDVAREMRESLEVAKASLREHRAQMQAAGIVSRHDREPPEP